MFQKLLVAAIIIGCAFVWAQVRKETNNDAKIGTVEVKKVSTESIDERGIPYHMNYQGYLTDDAGDPINATLTMTFSIYASSSGGSPQWSETHNNVAVEYGLFNVILGNITPIPYSIFEPGLSRYLQLKVQSETLSPRIEITSAGYAYRAIKSDTASYLTGSVANADMVDNIHASSTLTPNYLYPLDSYGTLKMQKDCEKALIRVINIGTTNEGKGAIIGMTEQLRGTGIEGMGTNSSRGYGVAGGTGQITYPAGRAGVVGWGQTCGVYGRTDVSGGYGVWGYSSGGAYGVYYTGGIGGTGKNSVVVKSSKGPVALNVQASPENWFEDFGGSRLVNGRVFVRLDPLFLEAVEINDVHPIKVYVQLTDQCNGVYVRKHANGFEVIELNSGRSNASFDYRIVAKRKNFQNDRFEIIPASYNDAYLYPEKAGDVTIKNYGN